MANNTIMQNVFRISKFKIEVFLKYFPNFRYIINKYFLVLIMYFDIAFLMSTNPQ